jgi:hypothetical protein
MNAVWVKLQSILVAVWEEDMLEKKLEKKWELGQENR